MWIDKLAHGVLALDTPIGPRYLQPGFVQRALLLWTFRNFDSLPQQVLHTSERRLIDRLANENKFVSLAAEYYERPIIGRVEWRKPQPAGFREEVLGDVRGEIRGEVRGDVLPIRKPVSASARVVEHGREAASA
jgi:hypothetical protein